ncbi:hypothetical protein BDV32DRAFT_82028 [Aspergillus pseudonomiae]|uniref:Uncharacterized protein n=1 Tax=Aspergillus pseudonomiae TaxID=1506151 RepID=A0A5N6HVL4_9EURO|nr:uncharacterized protein BDV37DRAFT_195993 [Aspergillus pseudonomiae]KAB8257450.1 hypothetical protein BDV32DRAFT_82028 [Aspergillus pseudonomiae]KAE8400859.1 hypothetical protein BDV37DRAFT_195993 [Aspergillus pseudonomiae]
MHKSILTRTTLLHLILNPFLTIPTRASTTIAPPTILSQRLFRTPIAYPQCPSNLYQEKSYSTMSSSTDQIQQQQSDNAATDSAAEKKPEQYLALPDSSSADQTQQLDLSGDGSTVKLDHLGPLVVNQDGTLSRISNWAQMAEIEKKNTLRVLGKRNKQRMEALKAAQGAQEEGK